MWISNAIKSTKGISQKNQNRMRQAFASGNYRTELIVVKPRISGTSINRNFARNATFGANGTDPIDRVRIIEVDVN